MPFLDLEERKNFLKFKAQKFIQDIQQQIEC